MFLNNRLDLPLQVLAMGKLLVYKRLQFTPVSDATSFGFSFILFPDLDYFPVIRNQITLRPFGSLCERARDSCCQRFSCFCFNWLRSF